MRRSLRRTRTLLLMGVAPRAGLQLFGLCVAVAAATEPESKMDAKACAKLGFGPSLLCSSCTKLSEAVGSEDALVAECMGCCTQDVTNSETYAQATLDICR